MSLDAPLAEGLPPSVSGAEISSLTNPITTPSCSVPGSQKSSSVSSRGSSKETNHNSTRRSNQNTVAGKRSGFSPGLSPKLTVRTPNSSNRNSLSSSINLKEKTPSRGGTPKSNVSRTPNLRESPRLPQSITTPDPFTSRGSTRRSSFHSHDGDISNNLSPTNTTNTSLTAAINQILYSRSSSRNCCHLCPNPRNCRHVCPDPRSCCHVCPRTPNSPASRDLRLATCNPHHQIEPYARSRKSDPQGYLFTCYLDYSRLIKPPPPACFDSYVRPESLQYSTCNSACESPRSSTSSSSFSLPGRRLYSRPPTPAPLTRAKEVHRIAMAGVPVDVKELANCYLFVAEIPGLKNTDVKVQVENDSILKISGERRREECDECEIKYIRVERQAGKFTRKFNLPANADLENITAACQDGLLSVVVPKNPPPEQRRPKNFEVKIAT